MDWSPVIAAGVSALGSLSNNAINSFRADADRDLQLQLYFQNRAFQRQDQQWTEDYAKRMMDYEYKNYSSPSAQMASYKAAGLNPYLMSQQGSVSGGDQVRPPSVPVPSAMSTPDLRRSLLSNPFDSGFNTLIQSSAVQNQRISAMSEMAKSIPSLVKGLGPDAAKRLLKNIYHENVNSEIQDELIDIEVQRQRISKDKEQLEYDISKEFDAAKAEVILTNLSLEAHKINSEANELYKRGKLHDAEIDELVTRSAKNLAEKAHLNADTDTINKLRPYVVKSAEMSSDMDYFDRQESAALFEQGTKARNWQVSEYGKNEALQQQVVENNRNASLINRIVRGNEKRQKRIR